MKVLNINKFIGGKNSSREQLRGIYYDAVSEVAVATNTTRLIASKAHYDPSLAGKIIDVKGNEIPGRYPNWKSVVPHIDNMTELDLRSKKDIRIDIERIKKGEGGMQTSLCIGDGVWVSREHAEMICMLPEHKLYVLKKRRPGSPVVFYGDIQTIIFMPKLSPYSDDYNDTIGVCPVYIPKP